MHSALFVATIGPTSRTWDDFLGYADNKVKPSDGVLRISANVWLIDATKALGALGVLIQLADSKGVAYGILPFERAPEWLPGAFHPTSMPRPD